MIIKEVKHRDLTPLFILKKEKVDFKYNDSTRYLGAFIDNEIVGVVGWQKIGHVLRYKTDGVLQKHRMKGIYAELWKQRELVCAEISKKKITAFCTEQSIHKYLKEGFFRITKKGTITFVER